MTRDLLIDRITTKHCICKPLIPLFCTLLLFATTPAHAAPALPPLLLQSLHQLNQMQGFSADFDQIITYQNGSRNHYSGTIAVLRPGKFRWHYRKPYAQTYVSDGDGIWHYEPDLMQAVRMQNLGDIDPVAMQLLDGRIHPKDITLVSASPSSSDSIRDFTVRMHDTMTLTLSLDQQGNLVGITHHDLMGNSNRITLSAVTSTPPDATLFHFTPPKGVDIVIEGE